MQQRVSLLSFKLLSNFLNFLFVIVVFVVSQGAADLCKNPNEAYLQYIKQPPAKGLFLLLSYSNDASFMVCFFCFHIPMMLRCCSTCSLCQPSQLVFQGVRKNFFWNFWNQPPFRSSNPYQHALRALVFMTLYTTGKRGQGGGVSTFCTH